MTNPAAAIRMLITYAICVPVAILVGWLLTNPMDYGTLGFLAFILAVLASPIFIKWHYAILIFGMGCPAWCFFLKGNPPLWQVVALLGFGIAVIERTLSSQRQFKSPASMVWPLLFIGAMAYFTAQMTGGIGLKTLGGAVGGGKKYLNIFIGIALFFAITSRYIPVNKRGFYVALAMLASTPAVFSDLFPILPSPLNYINLLFPPTSAAGAGTVGKVMRLAALGTAAGAVANYMLARYGLRGILDASKPLRLPLFCLLLMLTMMGGFRIVLVSYSLTLLILFFMEGLHRTRLVLLLVFAPLLLGLLIVPFSDKLPLSMQRSMTFLPLKWDAAAVMAAESSSEWRHKMWRDLWPKVPQYLLLGKGYALTAEDFMMMGNATFAGGVAVSLDASNEGLAISGDYHNGPLSTLIPFGIWGGIGIAWLQIAGLRVMLRNYKYGEDGLITVNRFFLVVYVISLFGFYFLFGSFSDAIVDYVKLIGFSIALNWGIARKPAPANINPRIKPLAAPELKPETT